MALRPVSSPRPWERSTRRRRPETHVSAGQVAGAVQLPQKPSDTLIVVVSRPPAAMTAKRRAPAARAHAVAVAVIACRARTKLRSLLEAVSQVFEKKPVE